MGVTLVILSLAREQSAVVDTRSASRHSLEEIGGTRANCDRSKLW